MIRTGAQYRESLKDGREIWINGERETVITTNLPTSNMDWQVLLNTDGAGGATVTRMTVGELIFQMASV